MYHAKALFCQPLWCLLNKPVNIVKHKEATIIIVTLTWHLHVKIGGIRKRYVKEEN